MGHADPPIRHHDHQIPQAQLERSRSLQTCQSPNREPNVTGVFKRRNLVSRLMRWLGGWTRHRLSYLVMVVLAPSTPPNESSAVAPRNA
jgi:hypothetical protein